jgi:glycine cleavage system H lipoate-binding protein
MFETAIGWLSSVALFMLGLIARVLLAVLVIVAIVLPMAAMLYLWKGMAFAADRALGLQRLGHVIWRRNCYYTPGHLWLKPNGAARLLVGLDDLAQRVLPDVAAVHLPMQGAAVRTGDPLGRIQCASGAVELRAPVDGRVRAVNQRLERNPSLIHSDPYRHGWMIELQPSDDRYRSFAFGNIARKWLAAEDVRLASFFERQLGVAAADGGELLLPPHKLLTPEQWDTIRSSFLDAAS